MFKDILRSPIRIPIRSVVPIYGDIWTPAQLFINGEQGVWYEPKPEYLYQDAAGTTPVTADGDPVGYMADLSGNGNHATQSTSAARPIYRTDGALHWLEFDGVDDYIVTPVLATAQDKAQLFTAVNKLSDGTTGALVETQNDGANSTGGYSLFAPSSSGANSYTFAANGGVIQNAGNGIFAPAPSTNVLTGIVDISGDLIALRNNGAVQNSTSGDFGTMSSFADRKVFIGRRDGGSLPFTGHVYGLTIRYGHNIGEPTLDSSESYLANLAGIQL